MRVIVVGAGIGGLSLAIGLRRAGHVPVVLEQAPRVEAVGAGITRLASSTTGISRSVPTGCTRSSAPRSRT